MRNHWAEIEKYLEDQKIAQELIGELRDFHMCYEVENQVKERVEKPDILFYGKKILEMSIAALLQGDNLLLSGAKATGKNVLCETLAWIFGRPEYDISFHVNTDSADLIGTDTFINNEVRLRKGPIYQCARAAIAPSVTARCFPNAPGSPAAAAHPQVLFTKSYPSRKKVPDFNPLFGRKNVLLQS